METKGFHLACAGGKGSGIVPNRREVGAGLRRGRTCQADSGWQAGGPRGGRSCPTEQCAEASAGGEASRLGRRVDRVWVTQGLSVRLGGAGDGSSKPHPHESPGGCGHCMHSSDGSPRALAGPGGSCAVHELASADPELRVICSVSQGTPGRVTSALNPGKKTPDLLKQNVMIFVIPACPAAWPVLWSPWAVRNGRGPGELALRHPVYGKGSPQVAADRGLECTPPPPVC